MPGGTFGLFTVVSMAVSMGSRRGTTTLCLCKEIKWVTHIPLPGTQGAHMGLEVAGRRPATGDPIGQVTAVEAYMRWFKGRQRPVDRVEGSGV